MIAVSLVVLKVCFGFRITKIFLNTAPLVFSAIVMSAVSCIITPIFDAVIWQFVCIAVCVAVYFGVLMLIPSTKKELTGIINKFLRRVK